MLTVARRLRRYIELRHTPHHVNLPATLSLLRSSVASNWGFYTASLAVTGSVMHFRFASSTDAALLAPLNHHLIRDEGHRNRMSLAELEARMTGWLEGEYKAVLVESDGVPIAYALFRHEPEHIYLRQLYVAEANRRLGLGRRLVGWLRENAWPIGVPVRLDVLVGNLGAQEFWRSVGFETYCLTMEARVE